MPQNVIFYLNHRWYVSCFTTGVKVAEPSSRLDDDTVMAHCLWLANQGKDDEAIDLLEWYCEQR